VSLETFMQWEEKLGLRRTVVLFYTLYLTGRAFEWAGAYVQTVGAENDAMLAAAAMVAAVTAPITYLQAAVFRAYLDSKA
jgi:hypothetical protein